MSKLVTIFLGLTLAAALLMAACMGLTFTQWDRKAIAVKRLLDLIDPETIVPLASVYFLSAFLMVILPIRAAGTVFSNCAEPLFFAVLALFAGMLGFALVMKGFGQGAPLQSMMDWRLLLVGAVIIVHMQITELRRVMLIRILAAAALVALALVPLYWQF